MGPAAAALLQYDTAEGEQDTPTQLFGKISFMHVVRHKDVWFKVKTDFGQVAQV